MFQIQSQILTISPNTLFMIGQFPVTSTVLMAVVNLFIFILILLSFSRFTVTNPSRYQLMIEYFFEGINNFMSQVAGSEKIGAKITPIVFNLIIFILLSNIANLFLPFIGALTLDGNSLLRSHTSDFNTTIAIAVGMVALVQIYAVRNTSIFAYIFKFIQIPQIISGFRKGIGSGVLSLIGAFTGILDIISEFSKIASLSLRLFGNVFAGELLVGVLTTILAIFLPIPIMLLSLLSGIIQSIVFGALVTSYLTGVITEDPIN